VITSFEALPTGGRPTPNCALALSDPNALAILPRLSLFCAHRNRGEDPFEEVILSKGQAARRSGVTVSSLHLKFHHGFERMRLKRLVRCT
jgi:hypothetical protein